MTVAVSVDAEFRRLIAPLSEDERAQLEANIARDGCRDALVVWNGVLLDGHNRFDICRRLDRPFKIRPISLPDRTAARIWIRWNQLGRRNITDDQRAMVVAALVDELAAQSKRTRAKTAGKVGGATGGRGRVKKIGSRDAVSRKPIDKTGVRTKTSRRARVSERKVKQAQTLIQRAPDLAEKVAAGELALLEATRAHEQSERAAARAANAAAAQAMIVDIDAAIQHAPFTTTAQQLDAASVSLIFTDPPYDDEFLPTYRDIGTVAARVLTDGGSLITYTPHHRLPDVVAMLQAAGLTFFWPLAVAYTSGTLARMREFGIIVHWKPLLWFVKGTFRSRTYPHFVDDLVELPKAEKTHHPWQQQIAPARYYIEALTQPGDLVFDPLCGAGTTAIAAKQAQRRYVTCDVDEASVWIARQRVRDAS